MQLFSLAIDFSLQIFVWWLIANCLGEYKSGEVSIFGGNLMKYMHSLDNSSLRVKLAVDLIAYYLNNQWYKSINYAWLFRVSFVQKLEYLSLKIRLLSMTVEMNLKEYVNTMLKGKYCLYLV